MVHFCDLVWLRKDQQRTVPEFTWTVPQAALLRRLGYGSLVHTQGRMTAFTSSKWTKILRQSNPGAHQKC